MSFQPVVLGGGLAAWQFLKATEPAQRASFDASKLQARETDYFRENIAAVQSAEDLVSDRRLLSVALDAFGLGADLQNKYFIRTVLEEGTLDPSALANKLADNRYSAMAKAFGFGDFATPRTQLSGFADEILVAAQSQAFEEAVGLQDDGIRQALYFERLLPDLVQDGGSDRTNWFRVMGDPALRSVMETTLGLPTGFGQLDLDKQLEIFQSKSQSRFGVNEVQDLAQPEVMEKVVRTFLLQRQIAEGASMTPYSIALTLLQR